MVEINYLYIVAILISLIGLVSINMMRLYDKEHWILWLWIPRISLAINVGLWTALLFPLWKN
jgi:hypothetical protein